MSQVVVAIGSNTEREKNICAALDELSKEFGEINISPVYESEATDARSLYYNLAVCFTTDLSPTAVKKICKDIEKTQYRQHGEITVTLDLDLLLYGDSVSTKDSLVLPHPDILVCDYILRPLAYLLPQRRHVTSDKTYQQLWKEKKHQHILKEVDFLWRGVLVSTSATYLSL